MPRVHSYATTVATLRTYTIHIQMSKYINVAYRRHNDQKNYHSSRTCTVDVHSDVNHHDHDHSDVYMHLIRRAFGYCSRDYRFQILLCEAYDYEKAAKIERAKRPVELSQSP